MMKFDKNDLDDFDYFRQIYEMIENFVETFEDSFGDKYELGWRESTDIQEYIYKKLGMNADEMNKKIKEAIVDYIENKRN